jgi:hypothetical protein
MERQNRSYLVSGRDRGVVFGFVVRKPASGLTATYDGGFVVVGGGQAPLPSRELVVSGGTIAITASKDAYLYVTSAGVLTKLEKTLGASKPTVSDIGADSEFIAKVVTDGSNITSVQDLRRDAPHGKIEVLGVEGSFVTAEQSDNVVICPWSGRLLAVAAVVTSVLGGTDAGTVTPAIGENDVFTGVTMDVGISFPLSSANGVRRLSFATALNAIRGGNALKLTTAKTTSGGLLHMQAFVEVAR